MKAILYRFGDGVPVGAHNVTDDCRAIKWGGGVFLRTETEVVLADGTKAIAFDGCLIDMIGTLDIAEGPEATRKLIDSGLTEFEQRLVHFRDVLRFGSDEPEEPLPHPVGIDRRVPRYYPDDGLADEVKRQLRGER